MFTKEININVKDTTLEGNLTIPANPKGLVIFSHGSGSSRFSPRNNFVANILQTKGIATLLFDLLTEQEDRVYQNRFDINKLTKRLIETTQWVYHNEDILRQPIGYFGASTGAASALRAAAFFGNSISAVVSRGGRPDLALDELDKVKAPTLLLVGGYDKEVIWLNQKAYEQLECQKKMEIVPGASHLFEEPGKLESVADLAAEWFDKWFKKTKEDVSE
ncbi:MAG: dienelactone hydrolase family protein [Allomuricauda sp.]|jgi:dienelactone hydrolase